MKRIIALLLALVTLTLCFAACAETSGSDETTKGDEIAAPVETEGETAPVETEPPTDEWGRPYV